MQAVLFIGLQASGKSSFFLERFYATHIRLNMDMLKTRHRETLLFRALLAAKQPFVIDNMNPTLADRQRYIPEIKANKFELQGFFFQSRLQACLERNAQREGKQRIPDAGLRAVHAKLEMPRLDEGFDKLFFVSLRDNQFKVSGWRDDV